MSTKSLVSAKVLGGGIAGASGIVGTGYGITKYFKSEETNVPDQPSQPTDEIVKEVQDPTPSSGVQSPQALEADSEEPKTDEGQKVSKSLPSPDISDGEQLRTEQVGSTKTNEGPVPEKTADTDPSGSTVAQTSGESQNSLGQPQAALESEAPASGETSGVQAGKSVEAGPSNSTLT